MCCVRRVSFAGIVYHICCSRNKQVVFQNLVYPPKVIAKETMKDVKGVVAGWRNMGKTLENIRLCQEIGVPNSVCGL